MPPADLDALFGDGAELGQGVVVKAQLRFRVHPPRHPAARDVLDRVVAAYDERLSMIVDEIAEAVRRPDRSKLDAPPLVLDGAPLEVAKAVRAPFRPGSRGGKWYRDSKGNIRYGDPPEGRFMGNGADLNQTPMPHLDHLRPDGFMGAFGNDRELTGFLLEHGAAHGFTEGELRFLGAWYGTAEDGGELFDAFLECTGLTRADLKDGVANLRFGGQQLTYEEAVFEFFAAQQPLFMGSGEEEETSKSDAKVKSKSKKPKKDDKGGEGDEEWNRVLNDEIKPLLDGVFIKYEEAKADELLQEEFKKEPDRQRRRFYDAARREEETTSGFAASAVGDWDPRRQAGAAIAGMRALGLLVCPARAERRAYVHGRPHLRDALMTDGRLLVDGAGNPLLGDKDRLVRLPADQLMLLHCAAELHRRWDSHSRSFSTESQVDAGSGDLGEAALAAVSAKSSKWSEASGVVRERLEELVDRLVADLNRVNAREGTPVKHAPASKRRSGR